MILYVDLLIISTFLVNYLFLKTISIICQSPKSNLLIIIGSIFGCLSLSFFFVPWKFIFILRYFLGVIIVAVGIPFINTKQKIIEIVVFYIMNLLLIGFLEIIKIEYKTIELILGIFITIIFIMILNIKKVENNKDTLYIKLEGKYFLSLIDNGNTAMFNEIPIVFIPLSIKNEKFKLIGNTEITTVSQINYHDVYSGPKLKISSKTYKVYYIFSKVLEKEIILNRRM